MVNWSTERDAFLKDLERAEETPSTAVSNPAGTVIVVHSRFPSFEGTGEGTVYAALAMCTGGGGRTYKDMGAVVLDDEWRPGRVGLSLPGQKGTGYSPSLEALGIGFVLDDLPACHGKKLPADLLLGATDRLFDDPLVSSVMTALWRDAEVHGASSAFFDHGISLVVHRLAALSGLEPQSIAHRPAQRRFLDVIDMIEAGLDQDLRVKDLARAAGLDERSFTRAFQRETRFTPFAYITRRRMERAKTLLRGGASVTQVAYAVGYANPAKFAAAFRRCIGAAPSEWRARIQ